MSKKNDGRRKFLNTMKVAEIFGVSRSTIGRWVKNKVFPEPIKIGGLLFWDGDVISHFIDGKNIPTGEVAPADTGGALGVGQISQFSQSKTAGTNLIKEKEDIRRRKLKYYIDTEYDGKQINLVNHKGINAGELSGLLGTKTFGERRARSLELTLGMKPGWLDEQEDSIPPVASIGKRKPQENKEDSFEQLVVQGFRAAPPEEKFKMIALANNWIDK